MISDATTCFSLGTISLKMPSEVFGRSLEAGSRGQEVLQLMFQPSISWRCISWQAQSCHEQIYMKPSVLTSGQAGKRDGQAVFID